MRIKWRKPPSRDEERSKTRFLFLPKTIDRETRWLEEATWVECCIRPYRWFFDFEVPLPIWVPTRWKD